MSDGRDKLNNFSLLKSLVGDKRIKDKTDRLRKAHAVAKARNEKIRTVQPQSAALERSTRRKLDITAEKQARHPREKSTFRMPQFGQKPDQKLAVELPETEAKPLIINIDVDKQRFKEEQKLFKWLCRRFPKCFNPKDKRPLKIGISSDIEIIYQKEHFAPVDPYILRNVIKRYVGDTRYQKSVLDHKMRFNLEGMPVEDFSEEHVGYAKQRLEEIAEKAELRAQGIDIKAYYRKKREAALLEKAEGESQRADNDHSRPSDHRQATGDNIIKDKKDHDQGDRK